MRKRDELTSPKSCLNKAKDDELIFVLLARDVAAPSVIRKWVVERMRLGKNHASDPQIVEALASADAMERERGNVSYGLCITPTSDHSGPHARNPGCVKWVTQ